MNSLKHLWTFEFAGLSTAAPAVCTQGNIYFSSDDGNIYALDKGGRQLWTFRYDDNPDPERVRICSSVMVSSSGNLILSCVIISPDGDRHGRLTKMVSLSKTGELEWTRCFKGESRVGQAEASDGTILFSAPIRDLQAFDCAGQSKWMFRAGGKLVTKPCIGPDDTTYFGAADRRVYAIDSLGTKRWDFEIGSRSMSDLSVASGGQLCFGTAEGELFVVDPLGELKLRAKVGEDLSDMGSPIICADNSLVVRSPDGLHAFHPDGKLKWFIPVYEPKRTSVIAVADGKLYTLTGNGGGLSMIGINGELLGDYTDRTIGFENMSQPRATLTDEGILYFTSGRKLHAILCPFGLADAPWPLEEKNAQNIRRADPRFKELVEYGAGTRTMGDGKYVFYSPADAENSEIQIKPAGAEANEKDTESTIPAVGKAQRLPLRLPAHQFTKEEVLKQLDESCDFPMLDNGYVYPACVRVSVYRDELRWAMVIEVVGWNNHGTEHQAIQNALHCFGNWISQEPGLSDDGFLHMTRDGDEGATFVDPVVDPEARTLYVREKLLSIPPAKKIRTDMGIELEEPDVIQGFELLRALVSEHRELFLATEEELRGRVPAELPLILRLDEWHHPDIAGDELPSESESFQMLAEVLASGDTTKYKPTEPPNTDWKHWPMGGRS